MPLRQFSSAHPLDSAIDTISWVRQEEPSLRKLIDLVKQNPDIFGTGESPLALASDLLEQHVNDIAARQSELRLVVSKK